MDWAGIQDLTTGLAITDRFIGVSDEGSDKKSRRKERRARAFSEKIQLTTRIICAVITPRTVRSHYNTRFIFSSTRAWRCVIVYSHRTTTQATMVGEVTPFSQPGFKLLHLAQKRKRNKNYCMSVCIAKKKSKHTKKTLGLANKKGRQLRERP